MLQHILLIAHGSVQGVGFRNFACRIGSSLSLVGYAKNLPNGTVEIVAEGEWEKLEEFARRIHIKMPYGIHVQKLETIEKKEIEKKSFASFGVAF
jgi:acylphosphatase